MVTAKIKLNGNRDEKKDVIFHLENGQMFMHEIFNIVKWNGWPEIH